jgi:hypothetical protein
MIIKIVGCYNYSRGTGYYKSVVARVIDVIIGGKKSHTFCQVLEVYNHGKGN